MAKVTRKSAFIAASDEAIAGLSFCADARPGSNQHQLLYVIMQAMGHTFVAGGERARRVPEKSCDARGTMWLDESKRRMLAEGVAAVAAVWPQFASEVTKRLPANAKRGTRETPAWLERSIASDSDSELQAIRAEPRSNRKKGDESDQERADAIAGKPYDIGADRVKRIRAKVNKRAS